MLRAPKEGAKRELLDGEMLVSPVGYTHGAICRRIFLALALHAEKHGAGEVLDSSMGYRLGASTARGSVLSPDVSLVTAARLRKMLPDPNKFIHGAPDLAVEVLSPSDSSATIERKLRKYFAHGARLVWVVDPYLEEVHVFTSAAHRRVLRKDEELDAAPVLSDFRLAVAKIFR